MPDEYVVVDSYQNVYYFDEKRLYEFLNKGPASDEDEERDDSEEGYTVLDSFLLPEEEEDDENSGTNDLGRDAQKRSYGEYCPFASSLWPHNAVFILKNGHTFIPRKIERTKTVTVVEYAPPPKRTRARRPAAKKSRK